MANSTFDFNRCNITLGGFVITGFADADDAVLITRRNDMWDLISGADGDSVFVKKSDFSGLVTLKLLPSSTSNEILSSIAFGQGQSGELPVPFLYQDENGNTVAAAEKAVIMKFPDHATGKNLGSNDWMILCADLSVFIGGMN